MRKHRLSIFVCLYRADRHRRRRNRKPRTCPVTSLPRDTFGAIIVRGDLYDYTKISGSRCLPYMRADDAEGVRRRAGASDAPGLLVLHQR